MDEVTYQACPDCGVPMAQVSGGYQCEDCTREKLGQVVRKAWVDYCIANNDFKPSHIMPWEGLSEWDKEVDRQIGEAVLRYAVENGISLV